MLFNDKDLYLLRAELWEDYIAFDDDLKFAVRILDDKANEVNVKVFSIKEEALEYVKNTTNKHFIKYNI